MTRSTVILTDVILVVVGATTYSNNDLHKYPVILVPLLVAAFATCIIRHVNYYHMTKRIF
jgi:hypothetical protein